VFTILFGVRNVQASEQHRGIMLAMAFESVVKLVALLTVGPFVLFVLFDGPSDLWRRLVDQPVILEQVTREGSPLSWVVTTLLSAMAFLCLPRQFHAAVVEHGHPASLRTARWLFPSYLVLVNVFVLPIAAAGLLLLGPRVNADLYVLQLPLSHGEGWLSALVFIGGLSAATSMVVVACMALSAMIGNELLMPYVLRRQQSWTRGGQQQMGPLVVFVRRAAVVLILMAAYAYEQVISGYLPLASIGLISFAAVSNFAPGLVLGLYWRRAHRYGFVAGLAGGFVVWLYALLLPSLSATPRGPAAPLHDWLPAPLTTLDPVGQGFVVAILVNTLLLVGVSLLVRAAGADAEQADAFVLGAEPERPTRPAPADAPRLGELRELLARFVGPDRAERALGGPMSLPNGLIQSYGGIWRAWLARSVSIGHGALLEAQIDAGAVERTQNYLNGASMLVTRRFYEAAGPMRENFFLYCEEIDWCLRAAARGMRLGFAPAGLVLHQQGTTTGYHGDLATRSRLSVYLDERNKMLLTRDHFPARLPVAAPSALLLMALRYLRKGAVRQFGYGISGWMAGLLGKSGTPAWMPAAKD